MLCGQELGAKTTSTINSLLHLRATLYIHINTVISVIRILRILCISFRFKDTASQSSMSKTPWTPSRRTISPLNSKKSHLRWYRPIRIRSTFHTMNIWSNMIPDSSVLSGRFHSVTQFSSLSAANNILQH